MDQNLIGRRNMSEIGSKNRCGPMLHNFIDIGPSFRQTGCEGLLQLIRCTKCKEKRVVRVHRAPKVLEAE
jgi:hypothetical protein